MEKAKLESQVADTVELAREDWDFAGQPSESSKAPMLRAQLLWEICRHLVINSATGIRLRDGTKEFKPLPNTGFKPLGVLGQRFHTYFPGGNLALSAVLQQFANYQGTIADVKIRISKNLKPWIPGNFPPWTSKGITDAHRLRFMTLAWPARPIEVVQITRESDIQNLCRRLRSELQKPPYPPGASHSSKAPVNVFITTPSSFECYSREVIEDAALSAIRAAKARPPGVTDTQLVAKLEGLSLLRLVLAHGKAGALHEIQSAKCPELQKLRFETKPWSPDWAKKCDATIRFLRELFPDNEAIGVLSARLDDARRI